MSDSVPPAYPPPPPPPPIPPYTPANTPPYAPAPYRPAAAGMSTLAIVAVTLLVSIVIGGGTVGVLYLVVIRGHISRSVSTSSPSASPTPSSVVPVTATSPLTPGMGRLVFADDFHDPNSGWPVGPLASGTVYSYSSAGYLVVAKGSLEHFARAPYTLPLSQIDMSMTATQADGAPAGTGFGLTCDTGKGTSHVRYMFFVNWPGAWQVLRAEGPDSVTNLSSILKEGSANAAPGQTPITVVGICATLADSHTVRLALFINGVLAVDLSDQLGEAPAGWYGGLAFASDASRPTTDTVTAFALRDISG